MGKTIKLSNEVIEFLNEQPGKTYSDKILSLKGNPKVTPGNPEVTPKNTKGNPKVTPGNLYLTESEIEDLIDKKIAEAKRGY